MDINSIKPVHVFVLLALFWMAWLYTEVTEYFERDSFMQATRKTMSEFDAFMDRGERFTNEDGVRLEGRIKAIEEELHPWDKREPDDDKAH